MPRHQPQRREVGAEHEVAVAALPARHRVAVDRVHLDVDGEQVVARLGGVRHHLVEEVGGGAALALQPALHVGERDEHGVDRPVVDLGGSCSSVSIPGGTASVRHPLLDVGELLVGAGLADRAGEPLAGREQVPAAEEDQRADRR